MKIKKNLDKHNDQETLAAQVVVDERVDVLVDLIIVAEGPDENVANQGATTCEHKQPREEAERVDDDERGEPEPEHQEDDLVEDVGRQAALERVLVDLVRVRSDLELAQHVTREVLRRDVVRVGLIARMWAQIAQA